MYLMFVLFNRISPFYFFSNAFRSATEDPNVLLRAFGKQGQGIV